MIQAVLTSSYVLPWRFPVKIQICKLVLKSWDTGGLGPHPGQRHLDEPVSSSWSLSLPCGFALSHSLLASGSFAFSTLTRTPGIAQGKDNFLSPLQEGQSTPKQEPNWGNVGFAVNRGREDWGELSLALGSESPLGA